MLVSKKTQYALRAVFELAKQAHREPAKIADIADAQGIPARFLEVILNQLKQEGLVESRRGKEGGYMLARSAHSIRVGDIIRAIEGPIGIMDCMNDDPTCPFQEDGCVFLPLWERARDALLKVYDGTSIEDLVEQEAEARRTFVPSYAI